MQCRSTFAGLLITPLALAPALAAADYPDRTTRFIVPYVAGGSADVLARVYADKLKDQLGQPVIVDNKPGATGTIGTDAAAKAPGDGYTVVLNSTAMVINPWLKRQPFDFAKDLALVAPTALTPYLLTVSAKLPVHNLAEFIAYTKARPGAVNCATYGIGSPPHLALELLNQEAQVRITHIPYKVSGAALPELLSGQLTCLIEPPPGALGMVKAGQLRFIAHTGDRPMSAYPGVEPIGRHYPRASIVGWQAVFAPASTPQPLLERLRAEWSRLLASPEVMQKIREAGFEPTQESVEDFAKVVAGDYEKFGKVIRDAGIKLD